MNAIVNKHATIERILCPICRASNRSDARFCQQCGNDVLLDNIYRLTRVIKEGGMGVVYQAIDEDGEVYALKEMHDRFTEPAEREEGIQRFVDEARLLRKLKTPGHPNIPQVYRSFIDEGRYYLSMEFIFGEDLEDILKRQKRFPEPQVLQWADQLCDVLEYMHAHGLIYRDMKPSNVMITHDGNIKVVDFGIAKLLQPGQRGTMVGTPGYAPPEQYQGLATPQSDVYALAATLHHLLTGRDPREELPFSFPPARSIRPDISQATSDALDKALQLELDDRFKTVTAFRRALPIPTGDRRPTRPFDPAPARRSQPAPVPPVAPRIPQPPRQVRPQAPPLPQPRSQAQLPPRRRGGVRRALATVLILGGLGYGAVTFGPELVPVIQSYFTELAQPAPDTTAPNTNAPATNLQPQQFSATVSVIVPSGASTDVIMQAAREAYLAEAQKQFPGAQLNQSSLPGRIGDPEVVQELPAEGKQQLSVALNGYVYVPSQ